MEKYISDIWKMDGGGHYTNQDDMYFQYLRKLLPNFIGGDVLEMGPGTGVFALKVINEYNLTKYNVLDLEKNIQDSINFLKLKGFGNVEYYYSQEYEKLFDRKFDLFVANIVVPETPKDYRENLLNHIIPNCRNAMIISQINPDNGYEEWIINLFNNNFDDVKKELTPYKNCYALTGEKK